MHAFRIRSLIIRVDICAFLFHSIKQMNIIAPGIYTSLQLLVLVAIGYAARKLNIIREGFSQTVSRFLVKIALPVYFFASFSAVDLSVIVDGVWVLVAGVFIFSIGLAAGWLVFLVVPAERKEKRAGIAMAGMGNSGYMPLTILQLLPVSIPFMAERFHAKEAAVYVGVYLLLSSPLLWSVGNSLIARHEEKFSLSQVFSPPTIGILAGLLVPVLGIGGIFTDEALPLYYVMSSLNRLGAVIFPMILVTLGVMIGEITFHRTKARKLGVIAFGILFVRFVLLPGLFFLSYRFFLFRFSLPPAILLAVFLEACTPPATNFSAMAVESGVNEDVTAFTLLASYIAYILILPVYIMLFIGLF